MGDNELKILITGSLNYGKTVGELNENIKIIEKKINKLKLKVDIDQKVLQKMNNFAKQMQRISESALNPNKIIEEMTNVDGSKIKRTFMDGYGGAFSEIKKQADESKNDQLKAIDEVAQGYDKLVRQAERYNALQKKIGETVTVSDKDGINSRTISANNKGQVTGYTDTYNAQKEQKLKEQVIKQEQELIEQMAKFREQSTARRIADEKKLEQAQADAINRAIVGNKQEIQAQEQLQREIQQTISLFQKEKEIQGQDLKRRFQNNISSDALDNQLSKIKTIDPTSFKDMKELRNWQKEINLGYKEIASNANVATSHTVSFGARMKEAFVGISVWGVATSGVYTFIRGLKEAVTQVIELDTQMTELKRVTNGEVDINKTLQESINLADKLGNTISEINNGFTNFAKQGFRGEDLKRMTEYATLLSNISDMSVEEASSAITAAVKGLKLSSEEALHVVDSFNEVDLRKVPYISNGIRKPRICWKPVLQPLIVISLRN